MTQTPARTPQNGQLHPEVDAAVQHISKKFHDHDELSAENTALRNRAEVAEGMVDHLKEQLRDVTAERDHYMRLSFEFTSRVNSIRGIIDAMMESAQHAASNPGPERTIEQISEL